MWKRHGRPCSNKSNQTPPDSWLFGIIWVFPKIGVPQNGWFIMENPIKWMIWGAHPYFWRATYLLHKHRAFMCGQSPKFSAIWDLSLSLAGEPTRPVVIIPKWAFICWRIEVESDQGKDVYDTMSQLILPFRHWTVIWKKNPDINLRLVFDIPGLSMYSKTKK